MMLLRYQNKEENEVEIMVESNLAGDYLPGQDPSQVIDDSNNVVLQWNNMCVSVRPTENCLTGKTKSPGKEIISNVSGTAIPGTLVAILGSSGSGKTTLLNALTLRSQSHFVCDGTILINGKKATPRKMDGVSAYIQQDDIFFGKMTVKEQLNFHALLSMDNTYTKYERNKKVEKVVKELGLAKCQDTMIGIPGRIQGISGGEKRRLSIACQILSDPPLLFCDEPTSGLDISSAQSVIVLLRKLAAKGKTILCTIHQPSSGQYILFHRIMLMTHGKLAFLGTSDEALTFFKRLEYPCPQNSSPADHFIHVLSSRGERNASKQICEAFALLQKDVAVTEDEISMPSKVLSDNKDQLTLPRYRTSFVRQFQTVLWRSWLGVVRDPLVNLVKTVSNMFMALMMGYVYWDQKKDQLGVSNMNYFVALFLALLVVQCLFSSIHVFSEEMPLFQRDKWNRLYSTRIYVLTKSLVDLPEYTVFPFLQTCVAFWMVGMADSWQQLLFAGGIMVLLSNSLVSFGYVISSFDSTIAGALGLAPFMIVPLITVGLNFINLSSIPWYFAWMHHISMFKYGMEALVINQWKDVTHIECNFDVSTCLRNGTYVLKFLDYDEDNIPKDIFGLVALTIAFRVLAVGFLSNQARRRQR